MATTCTAQILVGGSMNYWGGPGVGIGPVRVMYLVEGGRAAWILEPVAHSSEEGERGEPVTWIPSRPESILADGLVMIAALVDKDPEIRELIKDRLDPAETWPDEDQVDPSRAGELLAGHRADLTELPENFLHELESAALGSIRSKLIITAMSGSSLIGQIALLDQCSMDAEVCMVSWMRQTDAEGKTEVAGELPPDDPDAHRFYEVRI